jgi:hypothetical protein
MQGIFHVHSTYSYDGKNSLADLVDFCSGKGFSFIVLTEHAQDFDAEKMEAFVNECSSLSNETVTLIPGLEFGFTDYPDLHLLGLGITEIIDPVEITKTIERIHEQKGLAIIAHPSRNKHYIPKQIILLIDGIEVWNAAYDSRYLPNAKSLRLFNRLKEKNPALLAFSGMDMHSVDGFKEMTIRITEPCHNPQQIIARLADGSFINIGKLLKLCPRNKKGNITIALITAGRTLLNFSDAMYWNLKKLRNRP